MAGVLAYGTYVPCHRVGIGKRSRAVASFDEDTTTMAVAAARSVGGSPDTLLLATSAPAYLDKTNATAVHAALGLPSSVSALDLGAAPRSGAGALRLGLHSSGTTMAVLSDIRTGRAGGPDERDGGDAAAAVLLTGDDRPVVATLLGTASATAEYLDRWRLPDERFARRWDDGFGADVSAPLGEEALSAALKEAGLTIDDVDVLAVAGANAKAVKRVASDSGLPAGRQLTDVPGVGNAGTAQAGLLLAAALDRCGPDEVVVLVALGDGAEALVFRTTERHLPRVLTEVPPREVPYVTWLAWRGLVETEPSRTAAPRGVSAPAAARLRDWKFGLTGSRCADCGTPHFPPQQVCLQCRSQVMTPLAPTELTGTVVTYSVDRLAWSAGPPTCFVVVGLDGGGRVEVELADADSCRVDDRVELVFRRLHTADGRRNYFWKARPLTEEAS